MYIYHLSRKLNKIVVTPLSYPSCQSHQRNFLDISINIIMCSVYYIYCILYIPCTISIYNIVLIYAVYIAPLY